MNRMFIAFFALATLLAGAVTLAVFISDANLDARVLACGVTAFLGFATFTCWRAARGR